LFFLSKGVLACLEKVSFLFRDPCGFFFEKVDGPQNFGAILAQIEFFFSEKKIKFFQGHHRKARDLGHQQLAPRLSLLHLLHEPHPEHRGHGDARGKNFVQEM
jgi:hypothetical protein